MNHPNPYVAGRTTWNDRYQSLASSVRNWQVAAGVFALLAVGSNAGTVYVLRQRTVEVVVAQVDGQGTLLQTYPAGTQNVTIPEGTLVGAELARWIKQAREMSVDWQHQQNEYKSLWTKISGPAETMLTDYYKANKPQTTAASFTVSVQPTSIMQVSPTTWQLRWTETKAAKATGQEVDKTNWEAVLMVDRKPPQTMQQALENPLGLFVTGLSWTQSLPQ